MSLFWQEHKKLWRSGLTRLAVCGMLLLTLGLQVWAMQCINFGTMRADGSHQNRWIYEYSQESAICRPVANAHR